MATGEDAEMQQLMSTGTARQLRQRSAKNKQQEDSDESNETNRLKFQNPGKLNEFDPEVSSREMRKVNRRLNAGHNAGRSSAYNEVRRNAEKYEKSSYMKAGLYDAAGCLVADGRDMCDCLEPDCPGCHMPCPKCDSEKCGQECRQNRRWMYYEVEVEGGEQKFTFQ